MKKILSAIKPYLRWVILGGTLFFVLKAFKYHWQEVAAVRIETKGWLMLAIAFAITLLSHTWSGIVWTWILKTFKQPVRQGWAIQVYLITNIAKYLPGNVWHFYGRISAVSRAGGSLGAASLSVLLEPLLMAAAALLIALTSSGLGWIATASDARTWGLQILSLTVVLLGVHPGILNPVMHLLSRLKGNTADADTFEIKQYPLLPLLGELGFLLLRGTGFLFALMALTAVTPSQIPQLLSVFSFAWLLGLIVPGAPGGLGVFETTAIVALDKQNFPAGIILTVVALFRVVSILAEAAAAGLAWSLPRLRHPSGTLQGKRQK
ncbi:MAG: lysylphosphatidylglycerol synthase domain-containing protein [Xenococcaceae cyanobacterium]